MILFQQYMNIIHPKALDRIHLQVVREIDRQGSMTAAAGVLHLTQSALSHAMRKLERQLGTALWLREGRRLRPTEAAPYLLAVAHHLLPQLEHAESSLRQMARGTRGTLRIGMECHPCYQWLLKVVAQYLPQWPDVDVDVKQKFRFGGIGALLDHEIDLLVTPDPEPRPGLRFEPVFDYEQVLVVPRAHALARLKYVEPAQLADEVLITYPVVPDRLDIYTLFLMPAGVTPRAHRTIESTDLILEMIACGRGVGALPRWLVEERMKDVAIAAVRLGRKGVPKKIHLGLRQADLGRAWIKAFLQVARARRG